ncbi:MAG: zf-HC2 domain-containing protein [Thermoanaerobaculia bacterium]|nr:zf-HC2 domain-containing protein [Thermoanaerobaculia bacterium]
MKLARLLTGAQEDAGPSAGCLDETALAALVDGRLPGAERHEVEAHLADCGWCVRRLALLASLSQEEAGGEPLPRAQRAAATLVGAAGSRAIPVRWAVAAAAVVAVAAGGLGWQLAEMRHGSQPPPAEQSSAVGSTRAEPSVRDATARGVDERTAIDLLAPVGSSMVLDRQRRIRWSGVPESLRYTVTVSTADGTPLWEGESTRTEIRLPMALDLAPAETHFVQVRAHLPDGRTLRSGHIELEADDD